MPVMYYNKFYHIPSTKHQDVFQHTSCASSDLAAYNTLANGATFGATNLYGWTRGIVQGAARSYGTKIAQGEIKGGGFSTGATTVNANTAR